MLLLKRFLITKIIFFSCCIFIFCTSTILHAQSIGGTTSGSATYCTTTNSGVVTLSGHVGSILNWQSTTNGGITWNNNVNTTTNQTYFNLNQTTCYRAIVKNGIAPPDTSTEVCITIYPTSVGGTLSNGGNYCDSAAAGTLTLTGYSGSITNWLFSTNNGNSWSTLSNTTATENYPTITQNTIYAAVVQSNLACPSDTSSFAIFSISQFTQPGTLVGTPFACETSNNGAIYLTNYVGTVLAWESSTNGGTNWQTITNNIDSLVYTNLTQSITYHAIVKSGVCNADTSANFNISISPESVAGTLAGGGLFCGTNATDTLTLSGNTGAVVYWISSINNGLSWNIIANTSTFENYTNISAPTWFAAVVQSGTCPMDTSNVELVNVFPQTVSGTLTGNQTACYLSNNDTLLLSGNVGNVLNWLVSIDVGATWNIVTNSTTFQIYTGLTQTTLYSTIVQSGSCNVDTTDAFIVEVVPLPTINAGIDVVINQGETIVLNGTGQGAPLWSPTNGLTNTNTFSPSASPITTTIYVVSVTDSNSCVNSDSILITVIQQQFNGTISNLFTPNDDGINDVWHIEGIENFSENEVVVYNIYGNEVFRTTSYDNNWKGTYNNSSLPDGTYYYVITFNNSKAIFRGSVDIIRGL